MRGCWSKEERSISTANRFKPYTVAYTHCIVKASRASNGNCWDAGSGAEVRAKQKSAPLRWGTHLRDGCSSHPEQELESAVCGLQYTQACNHRKRLVL